MSTADHRGFHSPVGVADVITAAIVGLGTGVTYPLASLVPSGSVALGSLVVFGIPAAAGLVIGFLYRGTLAWIGFAAGLVLSTGVFVLASSGIHLDDPHDRGWFAFVALLAMTLVPGTVAFALGSWAGTRREGGSAGHADRTALCVHCGEPLWVNWREGDGYRCRRCKGHTPAAALDAQGATREP
jgi:hypothetical protein